MPGRLMGIDLCRQSCPHTPFERPATCPLPLPPAAGCDALAVHLILMNVACSLNIEMGWRLVAGCYCVMVPWVLAHWEEYHTGGWVGGWAGGRVGGWVGARRSGLRERTAAALLHAMCCVLCAVCCAAPLLQWRQPACSRTMLVHSHAPGTCILALLAGAMVYGNGFFGVTEANYSVVLVHLLTCAIRQASQPASQRWTVACTASMCGCGCAAPRGSGRGWSCGLDICDWVCVCRVAALKFLCCHTFHNCLAAGLRPGRGARSRPWQPAAWRSRRCRRWRSAS